MAIITLAVDPGKTGAIAVFYGRVLANVVDIPLREWEGRDVVDTTQLWAALHSNKPTVQAFIERAQPMPRDGKDKLFAYGTTYGILLAALQQLTSRVVSVPASVWKPAMRLGQDKQASLELARSTWPEHAKLFKRVKDHNRAEAALLGRYALDKGL